MVKAAIKPSNFDHQFESTFNEDYLRKKSNFVLASISGPINLARGGTFILESLVYSVEISGFYSLHDFSQYFREIKSFTSTSVQIDLTKLLIKGEQILIFP